MAISKHIQDLRQPIDGASLGVFRAGFGLMMLVSIIRFWTRGWIDELYVRPAMFFPYWGLSWVEPWPGAGMYVHFAVLGVLAALIMVGLWARPALLLFFVGFTYIELIDRTTYLNHYYLISILALLMVFLPVDRAFSLRRILRRPSGPETIPRWCLYAVRMQVGLVYVTAGLAKAVLRVDFEKVDQLGSPRGFAGLAQVLLTRQPVDRARLAGIGATGKSNFATRILDQLIDLERAG